MDIFNETVEYFQPLRPADEYHPKHQGSQSRLGCDYTHQLFFFKGFGMGLPKIVPQLYQ
jgi:hypothetical protein